MLSSIILASSLAFASSGHALQPFKPMVDSLARNKTCQVQASGDGSDDSDSFVAALEQCNNGGSVVFSADSEYTIGTALDLTYLQSVDIVIDGYVTMTNDTDYWQANSFNQTFQNATTFFQLGGTDVNLYGAGTLDGNGQAWFDLYAKNSSTLRPILLGVIGLNGGTIGPLKLRNSPQWFTLVANSSDVTFDGFDIAVASTSNNPAKNTDGWDTYRSDNIVIQNSLVNNGDDCVSFKPNSTNILVQNMHCNGSHGISVGSLGQYEGETDIVENVYVYNITMENASDMARIKVWPGSQAALSPDLQGGGGLGRVRNITYDTMTISNVDYGIEVTQCYGLSDVSLCHEIPSNVTISDVLFKNMQGTTSGKRDPLVGTIVCSSPDVCSNIVAENIDVVSPSGEKGYACGNVDNAQLGLNCTTDGLS